jgi:hypothetical protein
MKIPDPIIQKYKANKTRPGTYYLITEPDEIGIKYFVVSKPIIEKFKDQGATLIVESWTNNIKTLFTGLVKLPKTLNVSYGNRIENNDKRSLFCLVQEGDTYQIHYFKDYLPRSKRKQAYFLIAYFRDQLINMSV